MMNFQTADLCDQNEALIREGTIRIVEPMFNSYGGLAAFHGAISTLKVYEDNSLVRAALEQPGRNRVLVIDGGGSLRCALVGDQLALLALKNKWAGILVYGCIRDARSIGETDVGIFALDTHPLKSIKKGIGEVDIPVTFGGVTFVPGQWLYADEDGVLVSTTQL